MAIVSFFSAAFICGMILFASGAPTSTKCETPIDLKTYLEKLTTPTKSKLFLPLSDPATSSNETTVIQDGEKCPESLPIIGEARIRSTCPWLMKRITNNTLFPSSRFEAECRCEKCIGSQGWHVCERVYTEMMFLQQTTVCVNGFYIYKPITLKVSTGCVCANRKATQSSSSNQNTLPSDNGDI